MFKYLLMTKGAKYWHSWGIRVETLPTVKRRISEGIKRGLKESDILVFESKSPCECIYRIKQYIGGKWSNTPYIDPFNDKWSKYIYHYAEEHIDEYIKYRQTEIEEYEYAEASTMSEWVLRNDSSIRDFILWLWLNKCI